jgi:succinate dehydrogenase / fumarate reductase, cytochrome b subunit
MPTLKQKRPVNLDLTTIKLPPTAIVSILHRISGILIFLLMPVMLYGLQQSLISPEHFLKTQQCFQSSMMSFLAWIFLSALIYHGLAGVRHLLMDVGLGETASTGCKTAWLVLVLAFVLILCLGVALW